MKIKRIIIFILLFCLQTSFFVFPTSLKGEEKFETYSYEQVEQSIGYITLSSNNVVKHISTAYIIHQDDNYSYVASNAIVANKGYDRKLFFGNTSIEIELVGKDDVIDLSVFRFEKAKYHGKSLKMASSSSLHVGENIYYAGLVGFSDTNASVNEANPIFSKEQSFISKLDVLYCLNNYLFNCSNLMLLDSTLSSVSQGGPVFNIYGYIIGMVTMNNPVKNLENGDKLYHATFSDDIIIFLNRILKKDTDRADLGIYFEKVEDLSSTRQKYLNLTSVKTGTIITSAKNNTSLSGLGIDYLIVKINGKEVLNTNDLVREMYKYESGTILRVTARKTDGKLKTYYVKV